MVEASSAQGRGGCGHVGDDRLVLKPVGREVADHDERYLPGKALFPLVFVRGDDAPAALVEQERACGDSKGESVAAGRGQGEGIALAALAGSEGRAAAGTGMAGVYVGQARTAGFAEERSRLVAYRAACRPKHLACGFDDAVSQCAAVLRQVGAFFARA